MGVDDLLEVAYSSLYRYFTNGFLFGVAFEFLFFQVRVSNRTKDRPIVFLDTLREDSIDKRGTTMVRVNETTSKKKKED